MDQKYTVMEDGSNNWSSLLKKYLRNEITPAEKEEMSRQMQSSPLKQWQFKEQTGPDAFINDLKVVYSFDRKKARERLQAKLPFLQQPLVLPIYKRPSFWWRVGIAAAIIVVIISGWVLVSEFRNHDFPIKKYNYVKLPNGVEVNLETASNGMLYKTANYQIKYINGELVISLNGPMLNENLGDKIAVVTAAKKRISVRLSDGTEIQLNAQSTISTPIFFKNISRDVVFTGEAYFTIAKNNDIPFTVYLEDRIAVIAEGTIFNIRGYENQEVATTLIEGKVKMKSVSDSIILTKGEQAETINNKTIKAVKNPDIYQATAWRKGDFYFNNMPIRDVMIEIGRWYGYDVEFCGQGLINVPTSGKFERNVNIDSLILVLQKFNSIRIKKEGGKLLVSPK